MERLDRIFELLSEERRRYALYYLEQEDDPVGVDDLAEQIAEWETGGSTEAIPDETFEQIEVELYHHDLPKAAEEPFVRYNPESRMVELTGAPPHVDAVIHVAKVIERPERNPWQPIAPCVGIDRRIYWISEIPAAERSEYPGI